MKLVGDAALVVEDLRHLRVKRRGGEREDERKRPDDGVVFMIWLSRGNVFDSARQCTIAVTRGKENGDAPCVHTATLEAFPAGV